MHLPLRRPRRLPPPNAARSATAAEDRRGGAPARIGMRTADRGRFARRAEDGGLVVALAVIMVLTMLSAAVLVVSLSDVKSVGSQQNYSAALGQAQAGVSDALWRIDQGASATFCVGPSAQCSVKQVPAAPGAQYTATLTSPGQFTIRSQGIVAGVSHVVQETVTANPAYPFAIFGTSSIKLNGTKNSVSGAGIGSDGSVQCDGQGNDGTEQVAYGNATLSSQCANPHRLPNSTYAPPQPTVCATGQAWSNSAPCVPAALVPSSPGCLVSGTYQDVPVSVSTSGTTATIPGSQNGLQPGVYVCSGMTSVNFQSNNMGMPSNMPATAADGDGDGANGAANDFDADDGVQIYLFPPAGGTTDLHLYETPGQSIDINYYGSGSMPGSGSTPPTCHSGNYPGDPTKMRTYMAGDGTIDTSSGSDTSCYAGLIYAPAAAMTTNSLTVDGSIVVGSFTENGNPHLTVNYDQRMGQLTAPWSVADYTELPSSSFTLP